MTTANTNHVSDFAALPWCCELLSSPEIHDWSETEEHAPRVGPNVTNRLWAKTLTGDTRIRAWRELVAKNAVAPAIGAEAYLLVSLGADLDGYMTKLHGGMFGMLIDQVGGLCGRVMMKGKSAFMTMNIDLRFKKSIPLPSVVLCRSRCVKIEGKKMWMEASLEDGMGDVYCTATTFWLIRPHVKDTKI